MMKFIREEDCLFHASNRPHKYVRIENGRYIYPEDLMRESHKKKAERNEYKEMAQRRAMERNAQRSKERGAAASQQGTKAIVNAGKNIEAWQKRDHVKDTLTAPARGYKAAKRGVSAIRDISSERQKIRANKEAIAQQKEATEARRRAEEKKRRDAEARTKAEAEAKQKQLLRDSRKRKVNKAINDTKNTYKDYYGEYAEPINDLKRLKNKVKKRIR